MSFQHAGVATATDPAPSTLDNAPTPQSLSCTGNTTLFPPTRTIGRAPRSLQCWKPRRSSSSLTWREPWVSRVCVFVYACVMFVRIRECVHEFMCVRVCALRSVHLILSDGKCLSSRTL